MKNLAFVVLLLIVVFVGYNLINRPVEDVKELTSTEEITPPVIEEEAEQSSEEVNLTSPADMTEEAQAEMYDFIMEYNKCMMQGRLDATTQAQQAQQAANDILMKCDGILEQLKTHLLANDVNESLAIGMTNKMRSRGARQLMTKAMNNMAAQAAAAENAQRMEAETTSAQ